MANNKIGCSVGKTSLVDPNSFYGQNSSNNMSVPLEDLSINVELKTFKKGRTVLSASNGDGKADSTRTIKVSFLKGSVVNGKNVLTTNYTDLTTSFEKGNNNETLGITSIDIDFNSQQAPMVNINFIDLRGSAIFQNEDNVADGSNDYSTFFQLPYPLYELTVKGYYGRSVKYCLHMIKFNSKFNSQTGNFEITAQFVGYTYAMLSDMLIGYLKAIPYTEQGRIGYDAVNAERGAGGLQPILNLNELMFKISTINSLIEKVAGDDPDSAAIHTAEDKKDVIEQIKNQILTLGQTIDIGSKEKSDMYRYVIYDDNSNKEAFTSYVTGVRGLVEQFNVDSSFQLSVSQFTAPPQYIGLKVNEINPNIDLAPAMETALSLKLKTKVDKDYFDKKADIYNDLLVKGFAGEAEFNIYDMSSLYAKLDETVAEIEKATIKNKKSLAITLKTKIADAIGFEPTIRNVVEVFTTAVEVYLAAIYNVSVAAEGNALRTKQLEAKFGEVKSTDRTSNLYFPWPDYREKEGTGGYMEKYLGDPGVLAIPSNVNELAFIEDLKLAFQKAQQAADEAQSDLVNSETNWLPVNPIDTRLFVKDSPYKRVEGINKEEVIRLMLIRGMTFMGYSHSLDVLTDENIIAMATNECETVISDVPNMYTKAAMSKITLKDFVDSKGKVNGFEQNVVGKLGSDYYYNYILAATSGVTVDSSILIPISAPYEGNWSDSPYDSASTIDNMPVNKGLLSHAKTEVFLTNYGSKEIERYSNKKFAKTDDGGIYLKMFSLEKYNSEVLELRTTIEVTPKKLNNFGLKSETSNNSDFYVFGGPYGIQDYSLLNYGTDTSLTDLPLMYMFYDKHLFNGLAKTREYSKVAGKKEARTSTYDLINKDGDLLNNIKLPLFGVSGSDGYPGTSNLVYDIDDKYAPLHLEMGYNRRLSNKLTTENDKITYPFVNYLKSYIGYSEEKASAFSLFGSPWYYHQNKSSYPEYAKALLYLNTLPWNMGKDSKDINLSVGGTFEAQEIRHLFNKSAGFIHAPRLWCAYIGGLIWRYDETKPETDGSGKIIGGGSGSNDPILWNKMPANLESPNRDQYMNILGFTKSNYKTIHTLLKTMPEQAINEFKTVFFEFVNGTGDFSVSWDDISSMLEISDSYESFTASMVAVRSAINLSNDGLTATLPTSVLTSNFNGVSKIKGENLYNIFTPYIETKVGSDEYKELFLEFKGSYSDNKAVRIIVDSMREEIVIANTCYFVWSDTPSSSKRESVYVPSSKFELYFNTIVKNFNDRGDSLSTSSISNAQEQAVFGTSNDSVIKFQLYRTCKNIYDKWVGGAKSADKIIFQCGDNTSTYRNGIDTALAKKNRGSSSPRLIDSYRFVTRSFRDIGDELFINPTPVGDFLRNSPNSSMYDAVGGLLTDNYFNFTPLPTYINYNDKEILESMFDTLSYSEAIENGTCGPTFVCVYIGQTSKHLDTASSEYGNDGFDIQCDDKGGFKKELPGDFQSTDSEHENKIAVFAVNYSQQNQNIFKDISLDQSEFGETAESLQIVDDIATNLGSENNRTFAGQNIYNVYSVRSYKAEVEMMGNAMIQPMMYFQLNNIPMFHGAYMITHVKHNITPNYMSTNFTGVRIREPETKIFDASDLYMSIIDSLDTATMGGTASSGGSTPKSSPPILQTLIDNGVTASNISSGNIKACKVDKIPGAKFMLSPNTTMICEAVEPLTNMVKDWAAWMKKEGFKGVPGLKDTYLYITSMFRTTGNNSMHCFGLALDFQMFDKDGKIFMNQEENKQNVYNAFNFKKNPALKWLYNHAYEYGFVQPYWANDGKGVGTSDGEEWWHWEYHGTAAIYQLKKQPIPSVGDNKLTDNPLSDIKASKIKSFVKNPKGKDGKEGVYLNDDYKSTDVSDKANGVPFDIGTTISTDKDKAAAQLLTKNYFKKLGLTKSQVAGIMGNIQQESTFNPKAINKKDLNGYPSVGLIQWNGLYTPKGGSTSSSVVLNTIGDTVGKQLDYLVNEWPPYKTWLNLGDEKGTKKYSARATYEFARIVEVCDKCTEGYTTYEASYQVVRSTFAADFIKRFNDKKDPLYW